MGRWEPNARGRLAQAVADALPSATAMGTVGAMLKVAGALVEKSPELARLRHGIVSANAELRPATLSHLTGSSIGGGDSGRTQVRGQSCKLTGAVGMTEG